MMAISWVIFVIPLLLSPTQELPDDVLSVVGAEHGLDILGHALDEDTLRALITGKSAAAAADGKLVGEAERAVQNLGSSTESVRDKARLALIAEGEAILPALRQVEKSDARRAAEVRKVIDAIESRLDAARHDRVMARQFAIRYVAAKELRALIPAVREAASSDDPFVKIAAIDTLSRLGVETEATWEPPAPEWALLESLSLETRAIVSWNLDAPFGSGEPLTIGAFAAKIGAMVGEDPPEPDLRMAREEVIGWVRRYGNMRPTRMWLVNVGQAGSSGGLGIFVSGLYERDVLARSLGSSAAWTSTELSGYTVYNSPFLRLVTLSDNSVLFLPIMASARFPITEYLADLREGKKVLTEHDRFGRFLEALRDEIPVRAFIVSDETLMKEFYDMALPGAPADIADAVRAMEDLSLTVAPTAEDKIRVRLEASFGKDEAAKVLSASARAAVDELIGQVEGSIEGGPPAAGVILEILKGVTVTADGKKGILRFQAPRMKLEDLVSPFVFGMSVRG